MDIFGRSPKNERGEYFRNNWWGWRPLWTLTVMLCEDILNEEDIQGGQSNDGHIISAEKAIKIAKRINEKLKDGTIKTVVNEQNKKQKEAETYNKKHNLDVCNNDYRWEEAYPASVKNVRDFMAFVKNSGGFEFH